jgi:hypothetical protein
MLATLLSSHASDSAGGATSLWCDVDAESGWRQCCGGNSAVVRCRCRVRLATMLSSHVGDGDGVAGAT